MKSILKYSSSIISEPNQSIRLFNKNEKYYDDELIEMYYQFLVYAEKYFSNTIFRGTFENIKKTLFSQNDFETCIIRTSSFLKKSEVNSFLIQRFEEYFLQSSQIAYSKLIYFVGSEKFYKKYNPFNNSDDFMNFFLNSVLEYLKFDPFDFSFYCEEVGQLKVVEKFFEKVIYYIRVNPSKFDKDMVRGEINRLEHEKIKTRCNFIDEVVLNYRKLLKDLGKVNEYKILKSIYQEVRNSNQKLDGIIEQEAYRNKKRESFENRFFKQSLDILEIKEVLKGGVLEKLHLTEEYPPSELERIFNDLYEYDKSLEESIRSFIYKYFKPFNGNQKFRDKKLSESKTQLPINDRDIFIELFWNLHKVKAIKEPFSKIALFLSKLFSSQYKIEIDKGYIEGMPSEKGFKNNNTIQAFVKNKRRLYNKK